MPNQNLLPNEAQSVIDFWFGELTAKQHFAKDSQLDLTIKERFGDIHRRAHLCELEDWRQWPLGRLAEVLVLDQFSRNIFRDLPQAFASDSMALCLVQEAIAGGHDKALTMEQKVFLYIPYMHSESLAMQLQGMALFDQPGMEENYRFAEAHKVIIERFGRFPHRNELLGRESTLEELAFLQQPGSSF